MFKIVVDSGCDLSKEIKKENMEIIPLTLQLEDKDYIDDANLNIDTYIQAMHKSQNTRTAAPSPELYMDAFKGPESVFAITLSSKLSGSFNSAMLAKQMIFDEIGEKFIHVIDSLSASVGQTVIALKLGEFIENNFSDIEIVEKINKFMSEQQTFIILERYDNLVKTGRINPAIAKIASILSIKPVLRAESGEIKMMDKARGFNKAVTKLVGAIKNTNLNFEERILAISHVKCLERATAVKDEVIKHMKFKKIVIVETAGLSSTYANEQGVIVSF